jgi:glycosyltransferase involved in cell wall biosynthesis
MAGEPTFKPPRALGEPMVPPRTPGPEERELVSVVVTVRNEGRNLAALLDSLLQQEPPFEVLVVDSNSEDDTVPIAERYARDFPGTVRVLLHGGTRGESRNFGVQHAQGSIVAFIDGDCVASTGWLGALRAALDGKDVAAGATQQVGWSAFEDLERVELQYKGTDVTAPSCNLAYRKALFDAIGGFDPWFRTAEDIDLNFRAVDRGAQFAFVPEAVVFHRTRSTVRKFLKQALWNGYGRKQLTLKHGSLWGQYSLRRMLRTQMRFWGLVRLGAALFGYVVAKVRERPRPPTPQAELAATPAKAASPAARPERPHR